MILTPTLKIAWRDLSKEPVIGFTKTQKIFGGRRIIMITFYEGMMIYSLKQSTF